MMQSFKGIPLSSLRQKIIFGYSVIGVLVIGLSLFSFLELRLLERKIAAGERIAEFFDISLEIRRFEKNYFLYRQATDLNENREYVGRASALLREHDPLFEALDEPARIGRLAGDLERYAALMAEYGRGSDNEILASVIRKTGKEIVTVAEAMAKAERRTLQALLDRHRQILIGSVAGVTLLVIVIGQLLSRRVARPLKQMEASMEAVAAGQIAKLEMATEDSEIVSLTQAFNHVIQELELRQGQLVRSEKLAALGTLLSGVAHELNNPLSNIATSCQILVEEVEDTDPIYRQELLGQIDSETWRARQIVRSLLDYARDREFIGESLLVAPLIEEILRLLRGQIPAQMVVSSQVPVDLTILGDKQRLQQAFLNLIRNAIEATADSGNVQITARIISGERGPIPSGWLVFGQCVNQGAMAEIEIRDNGHGIAADILPRIFDPFFTTKEVGRGLGLGLFIVFEIIEEHGGCIAVESHPGKGTAFFVHLPTGDKNV
ncbi:MAG: ATP-binding protein [Sulfuritalea sp.]|jgi:signal transduction histidine kinase|nr:ATP-binding protein [Sulfuritalea sp.]